ncbi:hypothetical protein [uncultured Nocardioides sp.]|uniref:hypothetical protein n=1 Tax=uncultured Nocardioides sp. TaxID=198441 RepID=UPI00260FBFE6|nr:hypothetical protein [uncultured Nocardioides sp.]
MTGHAAPRVLVLGLDPFRVPGPWDPAPVAAAIEEGRRRFAEHGVAVEYCLVGLDGGDDVEAVVADRLGARDWGCVVVGGGIRTDDDLFERVLNLVHHRAPGAAIALGDSPTGTYDAAARWLPEPGTA